MAEDNGGAAKHAPLPWSVAYKTPSKFNSINDATGASVITIANEGDVRLMVRSVNAHQQLVEALEKIGEWATHTGKSEYDSKDAIERLNICKELARAALASAKGTTE
jgi:hypothetical protein